VAAIEVSLTDFARFVGASTPAAQVQTVQQATGDYEPAHDFYKGLREAIQAGHRNGRLADTIWDKVRSASDKKVQAYTECARGYIRFMERQTVEYVGRTRAWRWSGGDLDVKVNPELVADVRGVPMLLKIWFAAKEPSLQARRVIQQLLSEGVRDAQQPGILLARAGRVLAPVARIAHADVVLGATSDHFVGMWRRLD
jgi:hypothetical protein